MVEGGIFTILHNVLQELSEYNKNKEGFDYAPQI